MKMGFFVRSACQLDSTVPERAPRNHNHMLAITHSRATTHTHPSAHLICGFTVGGAGRERERERGSQLFGTKGKTTYSESIKLCYLPFSQRLGSCLLARASRAHRRILGKRDMVTPRFLRSSAAQACWWQRHSARTIIGIPGTQSSAPPSSSLRGKGFELLECFHIPKGQETPVQAHRLAPKPIPLPMFAYTNTHARALTPFFGRGIVEGRVTFVEQFLIKIFHFYGFCLKLKHCG